jgi:phosphatidylglycerophosphate synthase
MVMALRGAVATQGGLIAPSTWGKIKFGTQFLAIFLAFFRLPDRWGIWYLDQWVMLLAVIATVGSAWGYISAFWHTVRSEPTRART